MHATAAAHPGGAVTGPSLPCRHPSDRGRHRIVSTLIPHVCAPAYICSQAYICLRCRLRQFLTRVPLTGYPTHFGRCLTASGVPLPQFGRLHPNAIVRALFGSLRRVTCPFCVVLVFSCFGIDTIDARRDEWVFDHPRLGGVLRGSGGAYRRHRRCSRSWLPDRWSNPSALRPRCAAC